MTNEEILKKAIEKAVKNGYTLPDNFTVPLDEETKSEYCKYWIRNGDFLKIIFSHDFAEAIWGKELIPVENGTRVIEVKEKDGSMGGLEAEIAWQYHLQQMVLEKDPLQYLKRFLEKPSKAK